MEETQMKNYKEQMVEVPLKELETYIRAKQKNEQYKHFLINYAHKNKIADILCAIERKNLFELMEEDKKQNKEDIENV